MRRSVEAGTDITRLTDGELDALERVYRERGKIPLEYVNAAMLAVAEVRDRRRAELPSWVVCSFNPDSLWGVVEDVNSGRMIRFHSTSYHGRTWPYVGARVEVVFNHAGDLLALHEVVT